MAKVKRREAWRMRDAITFHAMSADPDVRFRVTWQNADGRYSYYHTQCAVEADIERFINPANPATRVKVHAIRKLNGRWAHWRAMCPHCRGSINVPSRKPEQVELIP